MKNLRLVPGAVLLIGAFALIQLGCGQSGPVADETVDRDEMVADVTPESHRTMTSAVTEVDVTDEMSAWTRVEEMLERVPGVRLVRGPGSGFRVLIRGLTSLHGSNDPLYVVDGMPMFVDPAQGLYWLNPRDVERIEVLKDVGSTAVYGMKGVNGVVLITTKR